MEAAPGTGKGSVGPIADHLAPHSGASLGEAEAAIATRSISARGSKKDDAKGVRTG